MIRLQPHHSPNVELCLDLCDKEKINGIEVNGQVKSKRGDTLRLVDFFFKFLFFMVGFLSLSKKYVVYL